MINKILYQISCTIYEFSLGFIKLIMVLLTSLLLISGFLFTCFSTDMETQLVLTKWDNPFFSLLETALFCLVLYWGIRLVSKIRALPAHRLLRFFVLGWCLLTGILLILFSRSVPAGDGYSVYSIAESLAAGDTSVIHPTDSYLSYYPQQAGLAAFWEILIRIWNLTRINLPAYHFIKLIYLLLECVIILFQEKLVHILWQDEKAECLYLLLAGANCPLLMYTSFVYGEIPSFAAISVGFYFLIRLLTEKKSAQSTEFGLSEPPIPGKQKTAVHSALLAFAGFFFLTLSVALRKNSLIFVIAAVLVMSLWGIRKKRPTLVLLAVFCTAGALTVLPCVQKYYENRSGNTLSSGVPAMSYFAMGMQESSRANGWYNGFNFYTYQDSGMDTETTIAISRDAIHQRMLYFREHPGYAVTFYAQKYLSQWADGTYACRQATLATFGGRVPFFVSLYEGDYSKYLISYCNIYQNILYLGAFWFCLAAWRKKPRLPEYLGLISVLGGFLFHMIWEANARYIFLYGLALLPFTARGLSLLSDAFRHFNNTLRLRKSP